MDAVEFLKAKVRMCKNMDSCTSCGLYEEHTDCDTRCFTHPDEAVAAVEKWAAEHPVKTRQSEFLKMFPNAPFSHNTIDICPSKVDVLQKCPKVTPDTLNMCVFCKREYWLAEVEQMRTTSDELLKKCGLVFITSPEKERIAKNECTAK